MGNLNGWKNFRHWLWFHKHFRNTTPPCRIYASLNPVSIGSDNGLSSIRHQAIIQTKAGLLSIGPLATNFSEILIKIQKFHSRTEHALENIVWEMAVILSRGGVGGGVGVAGDGVNVCMQKRRTFNLWSLAITITGRLFSAKALPGAIDLFSVG